MQKCAIFLRLTHYKGDVLSLMKNKGVKKGEKQTPTTPRTRTSSPQKTSSKDESEGEHVSCASVCQEGQWEVRQSLDSVGNRERNILGERQIKHSLRDNLRNILSASQRCPETSSIQNPKPTPNRHQTDAKPTPKQPQWRDFEFLATENGGKLHFLATEKRFGNF